MNWQVAIGLSVLASAITSLIQRQYAKTSTAPHTFPPFLSYALGVLPIGYLAGFVLLPHHIHWSAWLWLLLTIEAAAMAISGWTGFKAAGRLAVAPFQTIGQFYEVVVVLLGWTLLSERLNSQQLIGSFVLLFGALLAIWTPLSRASNLERRKVKIGTIALALVAATTLGIALVTEKAILGHMQIGGGFLVGWTAQTIGMLLLASKDINKANLRKLNRYELKTSTLMGLANGITGVFYVYAIVHSDNISLITVLTALTLPLTVLGAYIFLKERENQKLMWVSLSMSCAGLVISAIR